MKALTICQPWAWAIVNGRKRVENRTWHTHYRGPLLIHAGKSRKLLRDELPDGTPVPEDLTFGALVGIATVVDCVPLADAPPSPFNVGPWCWLLDNVWELSPAIPRRGALGLFNVPQPALVHAAVTYPHPWRDLFSDLPG